MRIFFSLILVLVLFSHIAAQNKLQKPVSANNSTYKEHYNYIAVNNIKMWIGNNGIGSHDPTTDFGGFYWPGGEKANKISIFNDGLLFGGVLNGEIVFGGSPGWSTLHPGKIFDEMKNDNPDKYRVYKINRDWEKLPPGQERELRKKDYEEWPIEDGAPYVDVDGDGKPTPSIDEPKLFGDETLWCVSNDVNSSHPLGLEIQVTLFGYKRTNILGDAVFKVYKIINGGVNYLQDIYFSFYTDPDIGDLNDDYIGCDTLLNMGFAWNSKNKDNIYGIPSPAVGYTIIQGPVVPGEISDSAFRFGKWEKGLKNLSMTAFMFNIYTPCWQCDPKPSLPDEYYNYIRGIYWDGDKIINPISGIETNKLLSGDPVEGSGWYEGDGWPNGPLPGDRRMYISSGPFNMAPGDTQEVVYAIHVAKGTSNISSISFLREQSWRLKEFYINEFGNPDTYTPQENIPDQYILEQNYPNPFNPATKIIYEIPYSGNVRLSVYDILGNEIAVLVDEDKPTGSYEVEWNAVNISAGVYFYQIDTAGFVKTRKMILMK